MQYKYIVFDELYAVVIPGSVTHADVSVRNMTPTSAGFFTLDLNNPERSKRVRVHGQSDTLVLSSHSRDAVLIALALGL